MVKYTRTYFFGPSLNFNLLSVPIIKQRKKEIDKVRACSREMRFGKSRLGYFSVYVEEGISIWYLISYKIEKNAY